MIIPNPESFLAVDVAPSQPTPYTTRPAGSQTWAPVLTDQFFKIRVMSNDCSVSGTLASATPIGVGCGGATLTTSGAPAPGSPSFGIQVHAPAGVPASVFVGSPASRGGIQLSTSCHLHLDPVSIGSTPILSGMTNQAGNLSMTAAVPLDPAIVGAQLTLQAAALVPNGLVGIGQPGFGLVLTQGVQIVVGY
jgi:hypothetical protein